MCGIVGSISNKNISEEHIRNSLSSINHRGPDSNGFKKFNKTKLGYVFLGHTRLSIIDLSKNGSQPMNDSDSKISITYNGEIYNFDEIKKELYNKGYSFNSNTDTEVIIYAYKEWGIKCVDKFIGMFAFAIYDELKEKLFIVRDRLGIKPLYYFSNNNEFAFASELKALTELPNFEKNISIKGLSLFTQYQYIPAPFSIYDHTFKLRPGHYIEVSKKGIIDKKYWDAKNYFNDILDFQSEKEILNELEQLIVSSVKYRMVSDVPIGSFLSGGIDSSLVSAIMQNLSSKPIETFSLGFNVRGYNEAKFAKKIANHLGTSHNELYVNPSQALDIIPNLSKFYDEPFADSSAIPTMIVSSLARKKVTVVLSGDGGDELFGGYLRYKFLSKLLSIPKPLKKILSYTLKRVGKDNFRYQKAGSVLSWNTIEDAYASLSNAWYSDDLNKLINFEIFRDQSQSMYYNNGKSIQEQLMFADINLYMVDDILTKVDRASMSTSLESRVPLLDHRIVEFALKLPLQYKIKDGKSKYILRKVLEKYVPNNLYDRPKSGFGIPVKEWLKNDLNNWMRDTLSKEELSKHHYFDINIIQKMIDDHSKSKYDYHLQLWTILMFQDWYKKYM